MVSFIPRHLSRDVLQDLPARIIETQDSGCAVEAHSEGLGKGSEFTVRLPLSEGAPAVAKSSAASPPEPASKRRILIADDNHDVEQLEGPEYVGVSRWNSEKA